MENKDSKGVPSLFEFMEATELVNSKFSMEWFIETIQKHWFDEEE